MFSRDWLSWNYWLQGNRRDCGSWGLSALAHVAGILLLASVWTVKLPDPSRPPDIDAAWTLEPEPIPIAHIETHSVSSSSLEGPEGGRAQGTILPEQQTAGRPSQIGPPASGGVALGHFLGMLAGMSGLGEDVGSLESLGIGAGGLGGEGDGDGTGKGNGSGGGFFGIRPDGRSIVYVVDCSRSMNHPHNSDAKTRFRRLKLELVKSIGMMHEDMQFFIIFFNDTAVPMPAPSLVYATVAQKQKYLGWLAQVRADGETDPRAALSIALRMKPDVIYLLTDGSFDRPVEKEVLSISQRSTVIHTFAFGNEAKRDGLKQLAERNRGKFHFVP